MTTGLIDYDIVILKGILLRANNQQLDKISEWIENEQLKRSINKVLENG